MPFMNKSICIIPARGGSKRIPKKNIKSFFDKPIISYAIDAALRSNLFDDIIVSTDSYEIAEIARKLGASVPFMRTEKNSNDFATTYDVLEEVLVELKKINRVYKYVCCLYPCVPLLDYNLLKKSFKSLISNKFDTVFPVIPFSYPIQRALDFKNGKVSLINDKNLNTRTQDIETKFHDAGQFYWCNIDNLLINKKIINSNSGGIILSELEVQDIDSVTDWKLTELKYKLKNGISG